MADTVEQAKRKAAEQAVKEHFDPEARYVGIGSGTTILYVVDAIKAASTNQNIKFVPTGYQSKQAVLAAGLTPIDFDSLPTNQVLDVAFDGADEVDEDLNCVKGGGACLFQEKLVAERAKKFVCVADYRKDQSRLLTKWPAIPIEVAPLARYTVIAALKALGSSNPVVRDDYMAKAGPIRTEQYFFIIDAPFPTLLTTGDAAKDPNGGDGTDGKWEVGKLSRAIKKITGVLEVGLFCGMDGVEATRAGLTGGQKPVAVYFGLQDGSVKVRTTRKDEAA
ncbi:ribose 5-phosphate isomerase [Pseudovirgaria hyperparasitica]|uniref:Ribose-5-phosphate isomerase n=1 Tax=Pseudovirgaria hyperparasitica TaxID=470096 RepID=A0A6A6W327_9PEZI|nr:ribose 5-phosphate isomerase [Pseudovirgaria hyperparasitica]KAF2755441.1 ribose 5-phosphate isomerase [Pseudovirgaria hyperparasitica]